MAAAFLSAMNDHTALLVFIIVFVAQLGIPLPICPVLISVGAFATGQISYMTALAAAVAGSVLADIIWFTIGWIHGPRRARYPRRIGAPKWPMVSIERSFDHWGGSLLMVVKLVPGLSMIAIPMAGARRMNWLRFILFSGVGGLLWASVELTVGLTMSAKLSRIVTIHTIPWTMGELLLGAAIGSWTVYLRVAHLDPAERTPMSHPERTCSWARWNGFAVSPFRYVTSLRSIERCHRSARQ